MKPEIIVKQQYLVNATGDVAYAVPEILLIGNREGFRQLGEWFLEVSLHEPDPKLIDCDPDDHQHLGTGYAPCNPALSDELEFRVGILTESNRDRVLSRYGITGAARQAGDMAIRYRRQAEIAERAVDDVNRRLGGA